MEYEPGRTSVAALLRALEPTLKYVGRQESPVETSLTNSAGTWLLATRQSAYAPGEGGRMTLRIQRRPEVEVGGFVAAWSGEDALHVVASAAPATATDDSSGTVEFSADFAVATEVARPELLARVTVEYRLGDTPECVTLVGVVPVVRP